MKAKYLTLSSLVLILAACGSTPRGTTLTMDEVRAMDYGSYPKNYQSLAKKHFEQTLLDPASARYGTFSQPRKMLTVREKPRQNSIYYDFDYYTSYFSCVNINAKNTYGGYTGWQTHMVKFKNGSVVYSQPESILCGREGEIVIEEPMGMTGFRIVGQ